MKHSKVINSSDGINLLKTIFLHAKINFFVIHTNEVYKSFASDDKNENY